MTKQEERKVKRARKQKIKGFLMSTVAVLVIVSMAVDWESLIF
jgi:hypothetical protein